MYLFDKKGNNVYVYNMDLNDRAAAIFREQELRKTGKLSCFKFETCKIDKNLSSIFEHKKNQVIDVPMSKLQYNKKIFADYHRIESDYNINPILGMYYDGAYNDANMLRVYDYDKIKMKLRIIKYFLVNQNYKLTLGRDGILNGVVSITEKLHFFELLQKGHFEYLDYVDISELLALFDISSNPVDEITLEGLEKLEHYNCGTATKDKIAEKIAKSEKVIKMARSQGYIK